MKQCDTDLLNAAAVGDLEAVKKAFNKGANVDAKEVGAARKVKIEYRTVTQDPRENAKQELGSNADLKRLEIDLFNPPYSVNKLQFTTTTEDIQNFQYHYTPLHWAAYKCHERNDNTSEHLAVAKFLIENKANMNAQDSHGQTPLHWAIRGGNFDIAELLVEQGANLDIKDTKGKTALDLALNNRDVTAVRYLIKKGANHISHPQDAFRWAAYRGFIDIVEHLLNIHKDAVKIDEIDKDGKTALDLAIKYGATAYMAPHRCIIAAFLIEKGAKRISNPQDALRYTALYGFTSILEYILNSNELNINYADKWGKTALDFSLENSHFHTTKFLLHSGADKVSNHNIDSLNSVRSFINNNHKTNMRYGALASIASAALLYCSYDYRYAAAFSCIALITSFYTSIDSKSKTAVMTSGYMASSALLLAVSCVDDRLSIALKISSAILAAATAGYSFRECTRDLV